MSIIDYYINQLLAEMRENTILHDTVLNIMDELILEAVKERLLKPLQPQEYRPTPPPGKRKGKKRKAIVRKFDPNHPSKALRTTTDCQKGVENVAKDELIFRQTPWVIGNCLRAWELYMFEGHPLSVDPRVFLVGVRTKTQEKFEEEIRALGSLKFQLVFKVQL